MMSSIMSARRSQPQIGALLRMAWEELQDELYQGLHAHGYDDFPPSLRPVMRYPPIDGMRPSELAAQLSLSKQATNDIVRELERLGYIRLERDPADGRARIVRYTERGWRFYDLGARLSRDVGRRWAREIGADQYACLEAALRSIVEKR